MTNLELALIGNGAIAALVNSVAEIVWGCFPAMDGDPAFCSLLRERGGADDFGYFAIDLVDFERAEQSYVGNTPLVRTLLYDRHGGCVEITDFAPRFIHFERIFCPMMLVRQVRRVTGVPRIRVVMRPAANAGATRRSITTGSHHIRYVDGDPVLRLTTDVSISAIVEERAFVLEDAVTLILGPDESLQGSARDIGERFARDTTSHWREWVRSLAIPFEWQDAVIRAAITLQLNAVEDTGAILAAVTTSVPEAAEGGRTWDYRFCWLRDGFMVVNALNRLGATRTMERFLSYIVNIAAGSPEGALQPVYGITGRERIDERIITSLPGYRGIGPVRIGNQAYEQVQHDVYGAAILAATHVFFDRRLVRHDDVALFERLEVLGARAARAFDQPDAGLWELRNRSDLHTYSAVMWWSACDRLALIAARLGLPEREAHWRTTAETLHRTICDRAWSASLNSFSGTFGGDTLDASLLLLQEVGFVTADDPRFAATVAAVERDLRRGDFVFRYSGEDDFGVPQNAFTVCTFWYINALVALGRRAEARALFENLLSSRTAHGLLAEHIDVGTREQWGNFVQTYSMVGLITSAIRLSKRWDEAF
ncbi:MAG: glycoside hydrolase family 15 protein [Gemmatimonadaceae bacterium]|nr:glycoside hydrolase family 15 protein [Gemmatimonadaceae bacterium]